MSEYDSLVDTLKDKGLVPMADSKEELESWMKDYVETKRLVPSVKVERSKVTADKAESLNTQPPRLTIFSGSSNRETTFDLWQYEVTHLLQDKTHPKEIILQAIRRFLKGDAGRVVMGLGPRADIGDILHKLTSVYGEVDYKETLMSEFYGSKQMKDEDGTVWSCRLENIIGRALTVGVISKGQSDNMLHDMLRKGLKPELKGITHYEKERFGTFEELRVALGKIQKENKLDENKDSNKLISKQAVAAEGENEETFSGILQQISHRLDTLDSGRPRYKSQYRGQRSRGKSRHFASGRYDRYENDQSEDHPTIKCRRCGKQRMQRK